MGRSRRHRHEQTDTREKQQQQQQQQRPACNARACGKAGGAVRLAAAQPGAGPSAGDKSGTMEHPGGERMGGGPPGTKKKAGKAKITRNATREQNHFSRRVTDKGGPGPGPGQQNEDQPPDRECARQSVHHQSTVCGDASSLISSLSAKRSASVLEMVTR